MSRDSFDILSTICAELATKHARLLSESERSWDDYHLKHANSALLACSQVSRAFREAALPFIFKTITLSTSWYQIETRMEALKSSALLIRYVRTVRFYPPIWNGLDIVNTRLRWIFREFASILSNLSLLRALAISTEDTRISQLLQQSFTSTQFVGYLSTRKGPPSRSILLQNVTDLSLDDDFQFLIEYCPNIRRLSGTEGCQLLVLLSGLTAHPELRSFTLNTWVTLTHLREIYYCIPNISELYLPKSRVTTNNYEGILAVLSQFTNLKKLHFGAVVNPNQTISPINAVPPVLGQGNPNLSPIGESGSGEDSNEEGFVNVAQKVLSSVQILSIKRHVYKRDQDGGSMKLVPP